jgi:hypothetical protein
MRMLFQAALFASPSRVSHVAYTGRSTGWYRPGSGEDDAGMGGLHERLEALASRLGDVDERSMRLQGE